MRDKLIVALLSVCCTLLAVNLLALSQTAAPAAHGQSAGTSTDGGDVVIVTVGNQQDVLAYVYHKVKKTLVAYNARSNGIRVNGVRFIGNDFNLKEYNKHFTVKQAAKLEGAGGE